MCGRFEQAQTRWHYARALGIDTSDGRKWAGGDHIACYNVAPGRCPWMIMLHNGKSEFIGITWGYRTPEEGAAKKKPWGNAGGDGLTGRYFRHMFREGRVIIPAGGWYEWTLENGTKQPWYITRRRGQPVFMAGLSDYKPLQFGAQRQLEVGFVIVTADSAGGMIDVHNRRPIILKPEDAWSWLIPETTVEEAAHIAKAKLLPTNEFVWWRVDKAVNRADHGNNGKHLVAPISEHR